MREKKFTPGPWMMLGGSDRLGYDILLSQNKYAPLGDFVCISSKHNAKANAHLISAAPELLDELEKVDIFICEICKRLNHQHEDCNSCEDRESRLAAINKAYGTKGTP